MEKYQMLRRKLLSLSNLSLFESETIFSRKIISQRKKKIIDINLCPGTVRSFVVQWSAKIAGRWPQLKPLSALVTTVFLDAKIGEVENKIPDHDKYIATIESDKFVTSIFDKNKNKLSNK